MTLAKDCTELFGTTDLYLILQLNKTDGKLTEAKIKKAYYQQSILWHPDRFSAAQFTEADRELATKKFQVIGKAYAILGDKQKRGAYDETGSLDDDEVLDDSTKDWVAVWRGMFKKVTPEDIEKYLAEFRGSKEEMEDVKKAYLKYKGNMDKILASVIGADEQNEDRIREIIRHFIAQGEVEAFPKFVNEPPSARIKRLKKAAREAKEAEKVLKEMQQKEANQPGTSGAASGDGDLASMILAKQKKRAEQQPDFLAHLAQKYGGASSSNSADDGPKKKRARKN